MLNRLKKLRIVCIMDKGNAKIYSHYKLQDKKTPSPNTISIM